ncbi:MAG: aldehyde dehydrogenase family protein [Acidimicrobiia bacterium]|jgi:aldehyde dehydrogenase
MEAAVLINGESLVVPSRPVVNPARWDDVVGRAAVGTSALAGSAVDAAGNAFPGWARLQAAERSELMLAAADAIEAGNEERAAVLTREHGKPLPEARHDVAGAPRILRYYACLATRFDSPEITEDELGHVERRHRPMGPMAVIVPWNAPVYLAFLMIAPALLAGNTLVVKPPSYTPLALSDTLRLLSSLLPDGVLNVVPGPGDVVGRALARHPAIRGIRFTGSTETGKQLMRDAADNVKNVGLELGGNDPALVLEGASLSDRLVSELVRGVYAGTGQICYNVKRLYVHRSHYTEFADLFIDAVSDLVVGDGLDPDVTMGPLNNEPQYEFVNDLVERTRSTGARVATVGIPQDGVNWDEGWFVLPSVATGVSPGDELVECEQFGPVVPIVVFDDEEEAVRMANQTEFGLAASVWDEDVDHALDVAGRIEAGTVFVNVHRVGASDVAMEFGGFKQSGLGRGHGWVAVEESSELQVIAHRPGWVERTAW